MSKLTVTVSQDSSSGIHHVSIVSADGGTRLGYSSKEPIELEIYGRKLNTSSWPPEAFDPPPYLHDDRGDHAPLLVAEESPGVASDHFVVLGMVEREKPMNQENDLDAPAAAPAVGLEHPAHVLDSGLTGSAPPS